MNVVPPFLTDEEIAAMCDPLVLPGAQCRYLAREGYLISRKPNGRPLLARSEYERVKGAARFGKAQNDASTGPNVTAMNEFLAKRKPHGKTAQRR
jgi:hypothetical protein